MVFYDDALLFRPQEIIRPFLTEFLRKGLGANFHTPNALNARFMSRELARLLVKSGFKNIYLGFESNAFAWQKRTGGKVYSEELARAVDHLIEAGANPHNLHAYIIVGHPMADDQAVEESMVFANSLGIRVMLSEFSPIPGTPDGELCRSWVDLEEPLWHNKAAYTIQYLGAGRVNRLKHLCHQLNKSINNLSQKHQVNTEEQAGLRRSFNQPYASRQGTFS
jgi:radical SAM superfamily enzyme YgiQ (UPF0313 family)